MGFNEVTVEPQCANVHTVSVMVAGYEDHEQALFGALMALFWEYTTLYEHGRADTMLDDITESVEANCGRTCL
jgi:hypothetical protein